MIMKHIFIRWIGRFRSLAVLSLLPLLPVGVSTAGDWPGWRGPTGIGLSDEQDLPLSWDAKTGENVLWKNNLTGITGHSSPIVWGDRLFLTTAAKQSRQQEEGKEIPDHHVACYRAADGEPLWQTLISPGKEVMGYGIYASPTPATDGQAIYAWFGSAVIAALDFSGKLLWRHERSGPFALNPGICSSPILYDDTVILICDQGRDQGFLQGLDKKTGEVKWEQKRKGLSYCNATPFVLDVQGKKQLIVAGSNALQGLDPADGNPIWWCKSWGFGASPAFGGGLIYADKGGKEQAIAVEPTGQGDVTATHVKWQLEKVAGDYASPVISGDWIYRVSGEGIVECRKLASGENRYTQRLDGMSKLASPIATADGRVYFASTGKSYVLRAGAEPDILGSGSLGGGGNGSSPAIAGGRIFVRDTESLFCIGRK
jgi:outer membrane protein assembly factor BamB